MGNPAGYQNRPLKFEFSGDASTIGTVTFYLPDGTSYVLATGEGFAMTDFILVTSVAARIDVINDTDAGGDVDNGERVLPSGDFAAKGGAAMALTTPVYFKIGTSPKIKSDTSGTQSFVGTGFIYR